VRALNSLSVKKAPAARLEASDQLGIGGNRPCHSGHFKAAMQGLASSYE